MIERNFIVKVGKISLNTMQTILPENAVPLPQNRQKSEMNSLSYDVNDHVYSKSKSSNYIRI